MTKQKCMMITSIRYKEKAKAKEKVRSLPRRFRMVSHSWGVLEEHLTIRTYVSDSCVKGQHVCAKCFGPHPIKEHPKS